MEYKGNEYELSLIDNVTISGSSDRWYIFCTNHKSYYLLLDGTLPKYDSKLHIELVYYSSEAAAWEFYENWKKTKEVGAVKKEKKAVTKEPVKRMSAEEFAGALKNI